MQRPAGGGQSRRHDEVRVGPRRGRDAGRERRSGELVVGKHHERGDRGWRPAPPCLRRAVSRGHSRAAIDAPGVGRRGTATGGCDSTSVAMSPRPGRRPPAGRRSSRSGSHDPIAAATTRTRSATVASGGRPRTTRRATASGLTGCDPGAASRSVIPHSHSATCSYGAASAAARDTSHPEYANRPAGSMHVRASRRRSSGPGRRGRVRRARYREPLHVVRRYRLCAAARTRSRATSPRLT